MTAHRAKSIKLGKINANIAKTMHPKGAIDIHLNLIDLGNPKWDAGKFKAISASSITPLMRPTFWFDPSMVRLLVGCLLYTSPSPRD